MLTRTRAYAMARAPQRVGAFLPGTGVKSDLFPYGLQISVAYKIFFELNPGQPGAERIREQLEEAFLRFEVAVRVDQLHVSARSQTHRLNQSPCGHKGSATSRAGARPFGGNRRPFTYLLTSLSHISLGRKMSGRRHSLFPKPG